MTQIGDRADGAWNIEELPRIGSTLSSVTDVTSAAPLQANQKPKRCFQGQNPVNHGFFLEPAQAAEMIRHDARNCEVIFPYMIGRDLVEEYEPTRWIIDFALRGQFDARSYEMPWKHVQNNVMSGKRFAGMDEQFVLFNVTNGRALVAVPRLHARHYVGYRTAFEIHHVSARNQAADF